MKFKARKNSFDKRNGGGVPWIVTMANAGVEYSVCGAASEAEAINLRDRFEACLPGAPVPAPRSVIELIRDFIGNIEESERRWNADYIASGVLAICGSEPVPAPRLEWRDYHKGETFEALTLDGEETPWLLVRGRSGTLGEDHWQLRCGWDIVLAMSPDIDYLKDKAEKLETALAAPPVGTQP